MPEAVVVDCYRHTDRMVVLVLHHWTVAMVVILQIQEVDLQEVDLKTRGGHMRKHLMPLW